MISLEYGLFHEVYEALDVADAVEYEISFSCTGPDAVLISIPIK